MNFVILLLTFFSSCFRFVGVENCMKGWTRIFVYVSLIIPINF